jgi:hypothetical protein
MQVGRVPSAAEGFASMGCRGYNGMHIDREVDRIMVSVTWLYLIPIVAFAVVGVLVVGTLRKGRWGINLESVRCPNCVTPMSARRRPMFRSQMLFGGWMCPRCGTKMDKWGRNVPGTAP